MVKGAKKLLQNPLTTEVIAATLVAAAALRDPKKAKRSLEAADDLKKAAKSGADGGALGSSPWTPRPPIDTVGKAMTAWKAKGRARRRSKAAVSEALNCPKCINTIIH